MKNGFVSALLAGLALLLTWGTPHAADAPAAPSLVAVKFHADWCGSCKAMGSVFEDLTNKFDGSPVLFVTFDRTNMTTKHQSELLASALGLGAVYSENSGTGFILLIDPATHKTLHKLTKDQTPKEMAKAIESKLGG